MEVHQLPSQDRVQVLYDNLCNLVNTNDSFYASESPTTTGTIYKVFSYRLSSYSDFLLPDAIEARGIMFEVTPSGSMIRIVARPMEKFWNVNENPFTMDLNYANVIRTYIKEDGSLISTFTELVNGERTLRTKSKTSVSSTQANAALSYIEADRVLKSKMEDMEHSGYTVNCEWTAPDNRIVVGYLEPKLVVLNARHRESGAYYDHSQLELIFPNHIVSTTQLVNSEAEIEHLRAHVGYEGVILEFNDGCNIKYAKLKNDWYLHRHRTKDSVNHPAALFDAVLYEASDDLKSLFAEDLLAMQLIDTMEALVIPLFNAMVKQCELFHHDNKDLDRREFAIKAQTSSFNGVDVRLHKLIFGALMHLYQGKVPDYKAALSKNKRSFIAAEV